MVLDTVRAQLLLLRVIVVMLCVLLGTSADAHVFLRVLRYVPFLQTFVLSLLWVFLREEILAAVVIVCVVVALMA